MDPLVTAALIGTAQSGAVETAAGTPLDTLTAQLPGNERERLLLLKAGTRAIYQFAGYTPPTTIAAPEPAQADELTPCSPQVADLLRSLIENGRDELQDMAFEHASAARLRLTPELLPLALNIRDEDKRRQLYPLLGARGIWLSQFNPKWSWATEALDTPGSALPADAETIWQEGTSGQRIEVLRRQRSADPALARQWIEAVWKREKAEFRTDLVQTLAINLSADDEALLERALDDKAGGVRSEAAKLLRSMPNSALGQRMQAHADSMLITAKGAFKVSPPTAIDATWERDGFTNSKSPSVGYRASWLVETLSCVPLSHWDQQLGMSPEELIAAAAETKWEEALLEGWTNAAAQFGAADWLMSLWNRWSQPTKKGDSQAAADEMYTLLAPQIPASEREVVALRLVADPTTPIGPRFYAVIAALEQPWSKNFGDAYLRGLRAFLASLDKKSKSADPWDDTLSLAALALPAASFPPVLTEPLSVPAEATNWNIQHFKNQLDEFTNTTQLRQRIYKEISA